MHHQEYHQVSRSEVMRGQSESWSQQGCDSVGMGQYQGLVGGSKGSDLQREDAGQKEDSKADQ